MALKVLLVEGRAVVREALRLLIEQEHDMRVVADASGLEEVVSLEVQPDVIVTELDVTDARSGEIIGALGQRFRGAAILVLTNVGQQLRVREAVKGGARGYLLKTATAEELLVGIRAVARGENYLQPSLGVALARADARASSAGGDVWGRLSPREEEVLRLIALGFTTREIAERAHVSQRTVEAQRARIMQKLGRPTRAGLVRHALEAGLLDLDE
jgi:DNA-binding NarL/FixJ family response regulator